MELYAVKYGENFKYASYKTVYRNDNCTGLVPDFVFLNYIAKVGNKVILFDTGFRNGETAKRNETTLYNVEEEIHALTGGKTDTVFITHAHFDHVENLDLYPTAELILSQGTWNEMEKSYPDLTRIWAGSEKLHTVNSEFSYQDLLKFSVINGHMNGSSVIVIDYQNKKYLIAGDEAYLCDNFIQNIPISMTFDAKKNADFIAMIHQKDIVPLTCHDGSIMKSYPKISEHIVRII